MTEREALALMRRCVAEFGNELEVSVVSLAEGDIAVHVTTPGLEGQVFEAHSWRDIQAIAATGLLVAAPERVREARDGSSPPVLIRTPARSQHFLCRCSFCGRRQDLPIRLIAAPGGVYICSECVTLCAEILGEEQPPGYWPVEKAQEETARSWYPDSCIICGEEIHSDDGDTSPDVVDAFFLETAGRTLHDATHFRCHLTCFRARAAPVEWVDYEEDDIDGGEEDEDDSDDWDENDDFEE